MHAIRGAVVLAALGYGVYRGLDLINGAAVLRVHRITVRGNDRLSNGEVLALVDGMRRANILFIDLTNWRRRLMASPWVADADLHRVLPSTIDVAIVERVPLGIARLGTELYLVDPGGVIIDQYGPNYADFDLPIVDGLGSGERNGAPLIDPARADLARRVMGALRARRDLATRVSQIDVTDPHDAVVIVEGETALVRLGEDQFAERLQAYMDLAAALHEQVPAIEYVDLRFDDRVYVRPAAESRRTAVGATRAARPGQASRTKKGKPG